MSRTVREPDDVDTSGTALVVCIVGVVGVNLAVDGLINLTVI